MGVDFFFVDWTYILYVYQFFMKYKMLNFFLFQPKLILWLKWGLLPHPWWNLWKCISLWLAHGCWCPSHPRPTLPHMLCNLQPLKYKVIMLKDGAFLWLSDILTCCSLKLNALQVVMELWIYTSQFILKYKKCLICRNDQKSLFWN